MAKEQKKTGSKIRLPDKWKGYVPKLLFVVAAFLYAFRGMLFGPDAHHLTQAELLQKAQQGQVVEVMYKDDTHLVAKLKGEDGPWEVTYPKPLATDTFKGLAAAGVKLKPERAEGFPWGSVLTFFLILMWWWIISSMALPALRSAIAKAKGQVVTSTRPTTTFNDVQGLPEVVTELKKIGDILKHPDQYTKLGARLPAGLVLYGPPGTGKTLLAKALAGDAGVPFYEVTGSSVRSMWIGQAGKAIRAYFEKARTNPVSIMFFDEGDTLGGRRSSRNEGGDQEHRAMVNELLAQMNPNRKGGRVFVIIATNDPELLDDALTRPGRIDLKLAVLPPDVKGRRAILGVHTKNKPLAPDVDLEKIAKATYGQNGAALEAVANNAALEAGAQGADAVADAHFEHALTVMHTGPARKDRVVTEHDRRVTAYHEAGHAVLAAVLEHVASPTSITILAHGYSGGHTMTIPDEERASQYTSKEAAKQELIMLMGGVAGEKLALNADFTNGAFSDRRAATNRAIEMVCHWGMGTYNASFDLDWRNGPHADEAWGQIEALLDEAERQAILLLLEHKSAFEELVKELLEKETLRANDLEGYNPVPVTPDEFEGLKHKYKKVIDSVESRVAERNHASKSLALTAVNGKGSA